MKEIIPGYFIPIWQEVMYKRRDYAIKVISILTLIPVNVLKKHAYFYQTKEDYLNNYENKLPNINIYFDYKYCVINISKKLYKRICIEGSSCLKDLDLNSKVYNDYLNICISFEDKHELITKRWSTGGTIDYLFLNIGTQKLKESFRTKTKNELINLLNILVINDNSQLDKYTGQDSVKEIIKKYQKNNHIKDWFRTYKDYQIYSDLRNFSIAESENNQSTY